jgi:hypothetical protein
MLSAFIPLWAALTSGFVLLAIAISITERNTRRSKKVKVKAKL